MLSNAIKRIAHVFPSNTFAMGKKIVLMAGMRKTVVSLYMLVLSDLHHEIFLTFTRTH